MSSAIVAVSWVWLVEVRGYECSEGLLGSRQSMRGAVQILRRKEESWLLVHVRLRSMADEN